MFKRVPSRPTPYRLLLLSLIAHLVAVAILLTIRVVQPVVAKPLRITRIYQVPRLVAESVPPPTATIEPAPLKKAPRLAFQTPQSTPLPRVQRDLLAPTQSFDLPPPPLPAVPQTLTAALPPPPPVLGRFGESATVAASRPSSINPAGFQAAQTITADHPVRILSKPRPAYTAIAKQSGIEGEVVLEVLFPKSGPARALRILQHLGYGLDESAESSVAAIDFRPASSNDQLFDSIAVVHILFQLAN